MQPTDFIIVTNSKFTTQANELATYHRENDGISVEVVDIEHIYNEFSSGQKDFLAIREFLRMMYNEYVKVRIQKMYFFLVMELLIIRIYLATTTIIFLPINLQVNTET